jgi:hypothetical protein
LVLRLSAPLPELLFVPAPTCAWGLLLRLPVMLTLGMRLTIMLKLELILTSSWLSVRMLMRVWRLSTPLMVE